MKLIFLLCVSLALFGTAAFGQESAEPAESSTSTITKLIEQAGAGGVGTEQVVVKSFTILSNALHNIIEERKARATAQIATPVPAAQPVFQNLSAVLEAQPQPAGAAVNSLDIADALFTKDERVVVENLWARGALVLEQPDLVQPTAAALPQQIAAATEKTRAANTVPVEQSDVIPPSKVGSLFMKARGVLNKEQEKRAAAGGKESAPLKIDKQFLKEQFNNPETRELIINAAQESVGLTNKISE